MWQKIVKNIVKVFIESAIPTFLLYAANSDVFFKKLVEAEILGKAVQVEELQEICLWISVILSGLLLSLNLLITKNKYDKTLEERNLLIQMNKNILSSSLGTVCSQKSLPLDVRIFIPKWPKLYKFSDFVHLKIQKKYIIKNIDLIADAGITKNLQFEVSPRSEGLVGICYKKKAMVYDDDLTRTNDKKYHLGKQQISRTSDLKWSICCPIFDDYNEVTAILALDGKSIIKIDKEKTHELQEQLIAFSRLLYDSVPQLFKR